MKRINFVPVVVILVGIVVFGNSLGRSYAQESEISIIDQALDEEEQKVQKGEGISQKRGESVKPLEDESGSQLNGTGTLHDVILSNDEDVFDAPVSSVIDILNVNETLVTDVLDVVSLKTGVKIKLRQEPEGRISIFLKDVEVDDALRIILEDQGFAFYKLSGSAEGKKNKAPVYEIMTAETFEQRFGYPFDQTRQTRLARLGNLTASLIVPDLRQIKTPTGKVIESEPPGTLILIDTPEAIQAMTRFIEERDVPLFTEIFPLGSLDPDLALKMVEPILTSSLGNVHLSEDQSRLVIMDTSAKINEAKAILTEVKEKEYAIGLEILVLQITLNVEYRDGVDWEAIVSDYQSLPYEKLDLTGAKTAGIEPKGTTEAQRRQVTKTFHSRDNHRFSFGTLSDEDFDVLLEALDTVGMIKTILSLETQVAEKATKEIRVILSPKATPSGTGGDKDLAETESVKMVKRVKIFKVFRDVKEVVRTEALDEALKIILTPRLTEEEMMDIIIQPRLLTAGQPAVRFFKEDILVAIKNKSTIVMGGLFKETKIEKMSKIPLLGDLPFLGFAFRKEGETVRQTEIVAFITPTIIEE